MSNTIGTLLVIARGDSQQPNSTTVDAVLSAALHGRSDADRTVRPDAATGIRVGATTEIAVRALSPLLDNALYYARDRVTLSVLDGDRTVSITVSDDGPGVDGERESLFAAGNTAPGSPGTGLGLALARRVAHTLGGDVSLTSPRDPTSFTLTLPKP
jgi:two-component system, OmpR family, sensor kinase